MRRWLEPGALLLGLGIFIAIACAIAQSRLLWYDEIFTRQVLEQGSWSRIMAALRRGLDLQPPLFFLVTGWTRPLGGDEIGLRIPAMLGFAAAGFSLYLIARRWFSQGYAVAALLAPCILWFNPLAVEARPYGLELGCAGLALLGWTYRDRQPFAKTIYLLGVLGAALIHYYGFLVAVPFGAAAAWTLMRRRRWDVWTIAGCVGAFLPDLWNYSLIRSGIAFYKQGAWNAPSGSKLLFSSYGWAVAALGAVFVASRWFAPPEKTQPQGNPSGEDLVCWAAFCAVPVVALGVAKVVSGMIAPRYVSMYSLGYGLLFVFLLARCANGARSLGYAAAGAASIAFLILAGSELQTAGRQRAEVLSNCASFADLLDRSAYRQSTLLIGDWTIAMQAAFYCPAIRDRMVFPADPERSLRYLGNDTAHKGLLHLRGSFPLHVEPLEELVHRSRHELLVFEVGQSFLKRYFTDEAEFAGRVHLLDEGATFSVYAVDPAPASAAARREMP
ncbi:MAG TPA: glycosyltransferase family 39 protein [Bryobacteraceae bacterium]|jgi:hypothetical protein|nr:glycosyltransferase family 39 protein [Bryobacteraceae bacterium]